MTGMLRHCLVLNSSSLPFVRYSFVYRSERTLHRCPAIQNARTIFTISNLPLADISQQVSSKGNEDVRQEEENAAEKCQGLMDMMFAHPYKDNSHLRRLTGSNILVKENAACPKIKQVEFIKSSPDEESCPKDGFPEFAVLGRSNVGKSSLINLLVDRKGIALISKKPGKTQLINHFLVNKTWYLVDLPGYGFAVAPKKVKAEWHEFTKSYFLERKTLVTVALLIDVTIKPQQLDLDCATWLGQNKIPMTLVFTKCDRKKKESKGGRHPVENLADFLQQLKLTYDQTPPWIMTSCITKQGKTDLLVHFEELRKYWLS